MGRRAFHHDWIMCHDPTMPLSYEWRPNKLTRHCVVAQHFVLRPITEVIYDQSLRKNVHRADWRISLNIQMALKSSILVGLTSFLFWNCLFFHVESEFLVYTSIKVSAAKIKICVFLKYHIVWVPTVWYLFFRISLRRVFFFKFPYFWAIAYNNS